MGLSMKDALAQLEYPQGPPQQPQQSLMPSEETQAVGWKQTSELPDDILEDFFASEMAETFHGDMTLILNLIGMDLH